MFNEYLKNDLYKDLSKKMKFSLIAAMFIFSGFYGFLYEYIFYYFNENTGDFYWRGSNFLPWLNIYAVGAIIIFFLTYKFRKSPIKVFLIAGSSCGLLEYIAGLALYLLRDGYRAWDYNTEILNFGNIQGFICLRSVLLFAISGLILIYVLVPLFIKLAKKVNQEILFKVVTVIFAIILADELYNTIFSKVLNTTTAWEIYESQGIKYIDRYCKY